jgi:putative ABC transport system permease protein
MLKTFLKTAWRKLFSHKLYSLINISGLSIGLASCVLIGLFIGNEVDYDRFHNLEDQIYRVTMQYSDVGTVVRTAVIGSKAGPELKKIFPSVLSFVRIKKKPCIIRIREHNYLLKNHLYADGDFLNIFTFKLREGNLPDLLKTPNQVLISETAARKYFGTENVMGKTFQIDNRFCVINGILYDPPGNSQIQFDLIESYSDIIKSGNEEWWDFNCVTYIQTNKTVTARSLQKDINLYMDSKVGRMSTNSSGTDYLRLRLETLESVHLYSELEGLEPNGNIEYVYIIASIGFFILVIVCFNYTNLAVAQSTKHVSEIYMRRVLGAGKWPLFFRNLVESAFLVLLAYYLGLLISSVALSFVNTRLGLNLRLARLFVPEVILTQFLFLFIISLAAGLYPAYVLSAVSTVQLPSRNSSSPISGTRIRDILIVVQFVISVFMISSSILITRQLNYLRQKDLGFKKDKILVLPVDESIRSHYDAVKKELLSSPQIINVTASFETPSLIQWEDRNTADNLADKKRIGDQSGPGGKKLSLNIIPVDPDFNKTLHIHILSGSDFTETDMTKTDTLSKRPSIYASYILNETAAKGMGWTPQSAIGKVIYQDDENRGIVKAVVNDIQLGSMHLAKGPVGFILDTAQIKEMLVKISPDNTPGAVDFIRNIWKVYSIDHPLSYHFLEDEYDILYKPDDNISIMFKIFSALMIFFACLGLFALAEFVTLARSKEIGIRKVLGATAVGLSIQLSKRFLKLILISTSIAVPLIYIFQVRWLSDFAYRINISSGLIMTAIGSAVLISLLTLGIQAYQSANINPVKNLN